MPSIATTARSCSRLATASSHSLVRRLPTKTVHRARSTRRCACRKNSSATPNRLRTQGKLPLQARVGVNTGEVVVRSIQTEGGRAEYTPIGHSTSLAARMQALAPVGSIATTNATRKLCEGYFTFKSLGPTLVKGVSEPIEVYEV